MNPSQRPAVREYIVDHRSKYGKLFPAADNADVGNNRLNYRQRVSQEGNPVVIKEGFIPAHAGALAAGQDKGR